MEPVDHVSTLVTVADACPVTKATPAPVVSGTPSVAARTYHLLVGTPHGHMSGDVVVTVHTDLLARLPLYGVETPEYRELLASDLTVRTPTRSTSGRR